MAIKKIRLRPPGSNDYGDILHPETSADLVVDTSTKVVMTKEERDKLIGIQAGAQVNTVTSVAGKTGAVTVTKGDVGLGNVDNVKQASKTEFDEHLAEKASHGIYTDTVQTNIKYKLVVIDEEPFLEVVEV